MPVCLSTNSHVRGEGGGGWGDTSFLRGMQAFQRLIRTLLSNTKLLEASVMELYWVDSLKAPPHTDMPVSARCLPSRLPAVSLCGIAEDSSRLSFAVPHSQTADSPDARSLAQAPVCVKMV